MNRGPCTTTGWFAPTLGSEIDPHELQALQQLLALFTERVHVTPTHLFLSFGEPAFDELEQREPDSAGVPVKTWLVGDRSVDRILEGLTTLCNRFQTVLLEAIEASHLVSGILCYYLPVSLKISTPIGRLPQLQATAYRVRFSWPYRSTIPDPWRSKTAGGGRGIQNRRTAMQHTCGPDSCGVERIISNCCRFSDCEHPCDPSQRWDYRERRHGPRCVLSPGLDHEGSSTRVNASGRADTPYRCFLTSTTVSVRMNASSTSV